MQEVTGNSDDNSDGQKPSQSFDFKELFGGEGGDDSDDDSDGISFDELFPTKPRK